MRNRTIFLVAGPSGSGKTTLVEHLCRADLGVSRVITVTTRGPRLGETEGRAYHFVSPPKFETMRLSGQFLETSNVYNESYGVPINAFHNDSDLVVIVSPEAALYLSELVGDTHTVFIKPTGPLAAAKRVRRRNASNETERTSLYQAEMAMAAQFETIICNNDFTRALNELSALVAQSRFHDWQMRHPRLNMGADATADDT